MPPRRSQTSPATSATCAMTLPDGAPCANAAVCDVGGASYCEARDPVGRVSTHAEIAAHRAKRTGLGTLYRAGARRDRDQEALHAALDEAFAERPAARRRRLRALHEAAVAEVARREREAVAALARLSEAAAAAEAARLELLSAFPEDKGAEQ